jgi:hypothetical protein
VTENSLGRFPNFADDYDKYLSAAAQISGESLKYPSPELQLKHNKPRTVPVK